MERWRPLPGYEEAYSVSDEGRVRLEVDRLPRMRAGTILTPSNDKNGYHLIGIRRPPEPQRVRRVALLVLLAWSPEARDGREANHKNGVRTDNRLANLEYVTAAENIRHAIEHLGRDYRGARNPDARLNDAAVMALRERRAAGESYPQLANDFGISPLMVAKIAQGKNWTHAGGPITRGPGRGHHS